MHDKTMTFSVHDDRENEMKEILTTVYDALKQKGYNPINQLVGYILSEDPRWWKLACRKQTGCRFFRGRDSELD